MVPISPMLLTSAHSPPDDDGRWAFEVKYDGYRAVLHCGPEGVRVHSRHGRELTVHFPELAAVPPALAGRRVLLDGELVVLDHMGRPRFEWLQSRARRTRGVDSAVLRRPATFVAFDLLMVDGRDLCPLPYAERRARLEALGVRGGAFLTAGMQLGLGAELLAVSRAHQLEGIVAKRLDSPYRPGTRSRDWLKIKNRLVSELVVGGWRCDRSTGVVDTLLLGQPQGDGTLRYRGAVELGLHGPLLRALRQLLRKLASNRSPFHAPVPGQFVEPALVAVVQHVCTPGYGLRDACLKGLRAMTARGALTDEAEH